MVKPPYAEWAVERHTPDLVAGGLYPLTDTNLTFFLRGPKVDWTSILGPRWSVQAGRIRVTAAHEFCPALSLCSWSRASALLCDFTASPCLVSLVHLSCFQFVTLVNAVRPCHALPSTVLAWLGASRGSGGPDIPGVSAPEGKSQCLSLVRMPGNCVSVVQAGLPSWASLGTNSASFHCVLCGGPESQLLLHALQTPVQILAISLKSLYSMLPGAMLGRAGWGHTGFESSSFLSV